MIWVVLVVLVIVAVAVNEIRMAPEVDDDYEVHLVEHYRRIRDGQAAAKPETPPKSDAA